MKLAPELNVNARIVAGLGLLVLLLIVILVTAFISLDDMRRSEQKVTEENIGNLYDLPTLRSNVNGQRLAIAVMLETPRDAWGPWIDEIHRRRRLGDSIINRLILRFRNEREESERLGAFIAVRDEYQRIQDTQMDLLVNGGKIAEAKAMFLGPEMKNYLKMRSIVADLEETELKEVRSIAAKSEEDAIALTRGFLIMGVFGALIAAALAVYMKRTVDSYVKEVGSAERSSLEANRALRMVNACNAIVIRASDETRLLEDVCREIVELGSYKLAWVGYADDDRNKSVRPMAFAGEDGDYVEHAQISWGDNERGHGPTGKCIRTGEIVIARDTSTQPGYDPWRYRANEKGYRSSATFPLKDGKRVYGALMVYSGTADAFDDQEVVLLKDLSNDLAYATTALRDQAARQQAEKRLRESAAFVRNLLDASLDPLMAVSPSGRITDVNAAMERATGKCRKELIGNDFAECFTEPEKLHAAHKEVLAGRSIRDYPQAIRHISGRTVDVLYNASVTRNEAGELQCVIAAVREVSGNL